MRYETNKHIGLTERIKEARRKDGHESQGGSHAVLVTPEELREELHKYSQANQIPPGYIGVIMSRVDPMKHLDEYEAGELLHALRLGFQSANNSDTTHDLSSDLLKLADACNESAKTRGKSFTTVQHDMIKRAVAQFSDPKACIETIINAVSQTYK